MAGAPQKPVICFGVFELDLAARQLRKNGTRVKLQDQPFRVLHLLTERPGEIVTREELKEKLWSDDTFVEFDHSLNTAIQKIRHALGDAAENPRFVETLPRTGYRFVTPVWHSQAGAAAFQVPRVAVLPLRTHGSDAELESFREGLTEQVTAGLSRFHHLAVVSASAAARFQGTVDVRQVGNELGARFVLGGSILKAGLSIRVNMELVDTSTGDQLWAERFDRGLGASDIFEVQDRFTDRIVATVADSSGVLTRSLAALVRAKPVETLTAAECVLLTFAYWEQVRPDLHAEVRTALERAVKQEPRHAEAWACLSRVYLDEYRFGFNVLPDMLDRALQAARQAVELDATSQNAYRSLAETHYYRREFTAFRAAAEKVLVLNPRDTSNIGMTSQLIAYGIGDWARGRAISEKVVEMNPHHAGWLNFMFVHDHYRTREYDQALQFAEKINMPGYNWVSGILAAIHGQLGNASAARKHVQTFVALAPDYARNFRIEALKWFPSEEFTEHIGEGLQKAGLDAELRRLDAGAS